MSSFEQRLEFSSEFEKCFIEEFNRYFQGRFQVIKFGIESTRLIEVHKLLRYCHDKVSHFVRYLPDAILVENVKGNEHRLCKNFLVEFKAGKTGIQKEEFFNEVKKECPNVNFVDKDDIFNIEKDALDIYLDLEKNLGIPIALILYAPYHKRETLYASFVSQISICNEYNPRRGIGSKTILYNISLCLLPTLTEFINSQLGITKHEVEEFVKRLKNNLAKLNGL